MRKTKTKWLAAIAALAVTALLAFSFGVSGLFASAAQDADTGYYYASFGSLDEGYAAAEDVNLTLAEEGIVLLKNDGSLPLSKGAKVSVFGVAQDCLNETTGNITGSLTNAGFKVNPTLESKYLNDGATNGNYGNETALTGQEKASISQYSDAAIVVIGRGAGGEAGDVSRNTGVAEDEEYLGNDQGWAHEAHETTGDKAMKHVLQLTPSEEELIELAEQTCDKVIFMYSSAYTFEMANLQNDPKINAILSIGRLGRGGIDAVGEILCGDVNPSGKVVDEWTRDFTNDPTYANTFAVGNEYVDSEGNWIQAESDLLAENVSNWTTVQNGGYAYARGIDYEEDIYLGYKFYETYWKEGGYGKDMVGEATTDGSIGDPDTWYAENVVYPMGYGMSYTDFSYTLNSVTLNTGATGNPKASETSWTSSTGGSIDISSLSTASSADLSTKYTSMTASVTVKNTGDVAGKETVQIYVEAPYGSAVTNGPSGSAIEKAAWVLVGYGKTGELAPDASETLDITFNIQDFASYDYADMNGDGNTGYELDCGQYTIHVMESSSHTNIDENTDSTHNDAYEAMSFTISDSSYSSGNYTAAHLSVDDYSGNEVENRFSDVPDFLDPSNSSTGAGSGNGATPTAADASDSQSDFYSMVMAEDAGSMVSPLTATETNPSTILSRSDFDGTMPKAPEAAKYTYSKGTDEEGNEIDIATMTSGGELELSKDALELYHKYEMLIADETEGYEDDGMIWAKSVSDIPASWTQGAGTIGANGMYSTTLADMAGVPWDVGETGSKWDAFMNQLTYDEMTSLLNESYHYTVALDTIGKVRTVDDNGPNYTISSSTMAWVGEPTIAATWNADLAYEQGRMYGEMALLTTNSSGICMTGWYGPGMNIHRNQFGGRAPEYYSQDAIQGGYIAQAVVRGATDMGMNVYVKHLAMYEITDQRGGGCCNVSEQAMRENYLKIFQMAMQEGGARACMSCFGRIGAVNSGHNYALITQVVRGEWGWNGFIVTDIFPQTWAMTMDTLVRAGADVPDANFTTNVNGHYALSGSWVAFDESDTSSAAYTTWGSHGGYVQVRAANEDEENPVSASSDVTNATQWYSVRMAATRLLYNEANSAGNNNGVTEQSKSVTMNVTQGTSASVDLIDGASYIADGHTIDKVVLDGEIFEAMTVSDGTLTGTVWGTEGGSGKITIYVDGWIPITVSVDVNVTPVINIGLASTLSTGSGVTAYVTLATGVSADSVSVSLLSGSLPSGLTLYKDGTISGTPTEAGDYDFTLAVDIVNNGVTTTYTLDYSISVTGDTVTGGTAGGTTGAVTSDELDQAVQDAVDAAMADSESSGGNGMAIAGLVIGIVAIVGVAAVLVVILMPKGKKKDE